MPTFQTDVDISGVEAFLNATGERIAEGTRPAAQAGSQVLYERVKLNVAGIRRITGNLASSIYQVFSSDNSWANRATYHVSWNAKKAPHGHLVEFGHLQRYRYYQGADGQVRPMVRPGMDGQTRPGRWASQAAKDAYYIPLETPRQVPARSFVRNAMAAFPQARQAAIAKMWEKVDP